MKKPTYTPREAARRVGVTEPAVRQRIGKEGGYVAVSEDPVLLRGDEVDVERRKNLDRFEDVLDLSDASEVGSVADERARAERAEARAAAAEAIMQQLLAARESIDEGIERIRLGERLLGDAAHAALRS